MLFFYFVDPLAKLFKLDYCKSLYDNFFDFYAGVEESGIRRGDLKLAKGFCGGDVRHFLKLFSYLVNFFT